MVFANEGNGLVIFNGLITDISWTNPTHEFFYAFTVGEVGAVPEPSTWAMMILGFAGVGFMGPTAVAIRPRRLARPDHQPDRVCRETAFGRSFCLGLPAARCLVQSRRHKEKPPAGGSSIQT